MEITFHDNYLLAIVIFLLFLCNVRTCCECLREWAHICEECACLTPECLGFRVHLCVQDCLRNVVRRALILFCFLQPISLALISIGNQWRKDVNATSTVMLCVPQTNFSALEFKGVGGVHGVEKDLADRSFNYLYGVISCLEVDYLLLCMPHALAVSVSTLIWLRLISDGVLYESLVWDDVVYSSANGAIFLYDLSYYLEILCMNVFFIFLTVQPLHGWAAYYMSVGLSLVIFYFVNMARYKAETQLDAMVAMVGSMVMAVIAIPFFLDLMETQTKFATAMMILHVFCVVLIVCGHYLAAAEATASYILSLRVFVTVCTCVVNIVLVGYGVNRMR